MTPDHEAEDGNGHAGTTHPRVPKNAFTGEASDQLADHAHSWQDHDVNGGMRIEPEEMLKKNRVASELRVKNSNAPQTFDRHERERDCQHGCGEDQNQARRIKGPN